MIIHVVKSGESLYSIARDYGVNPAQMAAENGLSMEEALVVGQTVAVQFPDVVHIVREGQTLYRIAEQYGTDVLTLLRNNRWLLGRTAVYPGEVLVVSYFRRPAGRLSVSGYAYPAIEPGLLRSTLPYLTCLTPFTYGLTREGRLLPPEEGWMPALAREYGVTPMLHLSAMTEQGAFSNGRSGMVLRDPALQRQLAGEVLDTLRAKGYGGVDLDFEFLPAEEGRLYADFVALMGEVLHPYGYRVTVALAPKTAADQPGLLYEGHDYGLLGRAADSVFLMTYEWGYRYGPPMAVAPLPQVRRVLEYALTEIPAEKIALGIPNYGYDWPLPFRQGSTEGRSLSPVEAVALARRYGAAISYDEQAQAPWFRYWDGTGQEHEVWFEDGRSIRQKLLLAVGRGLGGVGYWNLDRPYPQNWVVLNALVDLEH